MSSSSSEEENLVDAENINGLLLSNNFIPEEILLNILIFVNWKDLLSCRLVCQSWRRIIDGVVCFEKLKQFSLKTLQQSFTGPYKQLKPQSIPFYLYYAISIGAFGTNLLKNAFGSGDDPHVCQRDEGATSWRRFLRSGIDMPCSHSDCPKYRHWRILASEGNGWTVEAEPEGSEALPAHLPGRSCFVTSYGWCKMEQLITLSEHGLNAEIMDDIQPQIDISEWYARRWDCRVRYRLHAILLNSAQEVVQDFEASAGEDLEDNAWHEVTHSFKEYGPGVRHVLFIHSGSDAQFWSGHYGAKMAAGSVIARIPSARFQRERHNGC